MSRRKSDKHKDRLIMFLGAALFLSSALSSVIGYKALRALDSFNSLLESVSSLTRRSMVPEGY